MNAAAPGARPPLFSRADRRQVLTLQGLGALLVALAWYFASGRPDAGDQLAFVTLSLIGALAGTAASARLFLRGRRAVGARTALLLGQAPSTAADSRPRAGDFVAGPTARWYHRSDCLLAEGRTWPAASRSAHERAGRKACPACIAAPETCGSER